MGFTFQELWEGITRGLPLAAGVAVYGVVFGVLSRQAGLDLGHALLMSGTVFAGASQFVAMDLWHSPLPVLAIWSATFLVNLRHVLMGAALKGPFAGLTRKEKYVSLFFMVDESWAFALKCWNEGSPNRALMTGTGLIIFMAWLTATAVGNWIGIGAMDPAVWGIDFAFTAVFIFLARGLYRGGVDLIPWAVAAGVAVLAHHLLPGKWYILAGSLCGSFVGVLRHGD